MTPLITLVLARFLARFGYQMARSPVLPRFAQDLGAAPEMLGLIVAASTISHNTQSHRLVTIVTAQNIR